MMKLKAGIAILWIGLLTACNTQPEELSSIPGPAYFPLRAGDSFQYDVDSTSITLNVKTNYKFQLRVTVVDSFKNGEGSYTYRLQRHKRNDSSKPWTEAGTWSAYVNDRRVVVSEGALSYVKLEFPAVEGKKWNGNSLNTLGGNESCDGVGCDQYEVTQTGPELVVTENNDPDILTVYDVRKTTYKENVGLILRDITYYEYCSSGNDCLGKQFINKGLEFKQTLTASNRE